MGIMFLKKSLSLYVTKLSRCAYSAVYSFHVNVSYPIKESGLVLEAK